MNPKKSRLLRSSRTKSIGKDVARMKRSMAHVGVIALVVGVLLTTCVGSACSMEVLTNSQLAEVYGMDCPGTECGNPDFANCQDQHSCEQHPIWCTGTEKTNLAPLVDEQVPDGDTTAIRQVDTCLEKICTRNPESPYNCIPWGTGTGTDPVDDCYYPP